MERAAGAPLADHPGARPSDSKARPRRCLAAAPLQVRSLARGPKTFFIIAEDEDGPIGYAFVTVGRGDGVGAALIEAVWARLAEHGVDDLAITTTKTNGDAHCFYERHGFNQGFVVYHGKQPRKLACSS